MKVMKRKIALYAILIVMVLSGTGIGFYYWYKAAHFVETEDARIAGDIYRVMPRISGKLNSLSIKAGDTVVADQVVGQQDVTNLPTSMLDQSVLRAPISGKVIQTTAKVGEVVSPGQTVAMIVDERALYVSANIEETDLEKVKVGQPVDFTIDTYPEYQFTGKVVEIGEATTSTFSLIPTVNTSGNFTKVTQRTQVKISIDDDHGLKLSPGLSAVVRIHIKGN